MPDAPFLASTALITAASLLPAIRWRSLKSWLIGGLILCAGGFIAALALTEDAGFSFMRLSCWLIFAFIPAYLLLSSLFVNGSHRNLSFFLGISMLAVGIDAFFIEPRFLTANYHTIESPLIKRPLRIVSLADIQTDRIGDHERKALEYTRALQADLVVFPGDYVQERHQEKRLTLSKAFTQLLKDANLKPRLGAFAVEGDMENSAWIELFKNSGVRALDQSEVIDLGEIELAGLTLHDSRVGALLQPKKKFRVVVGHAPDFALRPVDADLLLAGHTHGGQVQIPFYGPILTLSRVPRAWAGGGLVNLEGGRHLIVSRGIGHERGPAPRLRFNCRPEIVVVDLVPMNKN